MKIKSKSWIDKRIEELITPHKHEIPFIIFASFFITFALSRFTVALIDSGVLPHVLFLHVRGVHIHHFNYGIILLAVSGFWALMTDKRRHLYLVSILYGIGLGLIADEFALILLLRDNYYASQSYDAIIAISTLLLSAIYFPSFWRVLGAVIKEVFRGE